MCVHVHTCRSFFSRAKVFEQPSRELKKNAEIWVLDLVSVEQPVLRLTSLGSVPRNGIAASEALHISSFTRYCQKSMLAFTMPARFKFLFPYILSNIWYYQSCKNFVHLKWFFPNLICIFSNSQYGWEPFLKCSGHLCFQIGGAGRGRVGRSARARTRKRISLFYTTHTQK